MKLNWIELLDCYIIDFFLFHFSHSYSILTIPNACTMLSTLPSAIKMSCSLLRTVHSSLITGENQGLKNAFKLRMKLLILRTKAEILLRYLLISNLQCKAKTNELALFFQSFHRGLCTVHTVQSLSRNEHLMNIAVNVVCCICCMYFSI